MSQISLPPSSSIFPSSDHLSPFLLHPNSRFAPFLNYLLVTLLLYLCYIFHSKISSKSHHHLSSFPSPPTLPLLGNGHQMLFRPTEFYSWTASLFSLYSQGTDTVLTWRLRFPMLWIKSYPLASELLQNPKFIAKSKDIQLLYNFPGGNGLSGSPAQIHNSRRKLLYPGYSRQVVLSSIPIFSEESLHLINQLKPFSKSGENFEILNLLMPTSFRVMCRSAFGDILSCQRSDAEALTHMHALHTISKNFTERLMSPYLYLRSDFLYFNFTQAGKVTKSCAQIINQFGQNAITQQLENRKGDIPQGKNPCYLDMLLNFQEKGYLKPNEVLGELNNYIVAGYDTTALTVAWTLFALALNDPIYQLKIVQELNQIFGMVPQSKWNMTSETIKEMRYLEMCVKEALRLYPTSPILPRSTTMDIQLKDGRIIPKDTDVLIMVNMIHRDSRYFPEPEKFWPERHLERNPAFMPFSVGVRNCIGQSFAMHQVKVELAYLVGAFQWETEERWETLPKLFQALLVPAEGIRFRIRPRE